MCAQDIDLVGDSSLAITALSADHPNEILERMGLRADLRIVGSTAPLCPMVNTNLRSEGETATGIFYLYCQRFVMPQYIIYIGLSLTGKSLNGILVKRTSYSEISF